MDVLDKLLAIAFSVGILAQAAVVRRLVGTWTCPACLFSLFWFLFTIVPLVVLFPVPVNPVAVAYVLLTCILFSLSALPFNWSAALEKNRTRGATQRYDSPFIGKAFYAISAVATGSMIISIGQQGFTLHDIIFDFFGVASRYIGLRYTDQVTVTIFSQLSFVLTYPGAILGGFVFNASDPKPRRALVLFAVLAPSLMALLIQGAKGNLFLALTLFWGAVLVRKLEHGDLTLVRHVNMVKAGAYMLVIGILVLCSFLSRGLYNQTNQELVLHGLFRYFVSYSCAHLYAFSDWFTHVTGGMSVMSYSADAETNGFYTFMSLFKLAGSQKITPLGVYNEYFQYSDFLMTNIYTWYRGLVTDFGLAGSLAFTFVFGLGLHIAFFRMLIADNKALAVSIYVHSIGFFYTSFIISLMIWNSSYASILVVALVLAANKFVSGARTLPAPLTQQSF